MRLGNILQAIYEIRSVFRVHGEPKAQPRAFASSKRGFAEMVTPRTADAWKKSVARAVTNATIDLEPFDFATHVEVWFFMPRPGGHVSKSTGNRLSTFRPFPSVKPDVDNLLKAVLDAINNSGAWKDDSLVCDLTIKTRYADGVLPGVAVQIDEMKEKP